MIPWEGIRGYQRVLTFEVPGESMVVEPGDWDGDGALDFVSVARSLGDGITQPRGNLVSTWMNRGTDGFVRGAEFYFAGADVRHGFMNAVSGDFNGDGLSDLVLEGTVIAGNLQQPVRQNIRPAASAGVYLSSGNGGFAEAIPLFENSADVLSLYQVGDLDGDGDDDVVRSIDLGAGRQVWMNVGAGHFDRKEASVSLPEHLTSGPRRGNDRRLYDVDGDGDLDVAVAGLDSVNYVYFNNGSGQFESLAQEGYGRSMLALFVTIEAE